MPLIASPKARTPAGLFLSWTQAAIGWVFPLQCAGCGRVDTAWCERCEDRLQAIPLQLQQRSVADFIGIASTGYHEGLLQTAIHALKFENVPTIADPLGARLADAILALAWPIEMVIPVPLHPKRLAQRGYNQSELLAQALIKRCRFDYEPEGLIRWRDTPHQVGLNARDRQVNVADAFKAHEGRIGGKIVLIIDDVLTTGATLSACATAVIEAGARAVYGVTVTTARGV
ncbi:MAG: ComF family protein [Anaerolineae bacterium]|jgi:ComF family protein|nr:ComF family protein [Anaerolineae bacterium]